MSKTLERIEVQCETDGCEAMIPGYAKYPDLMPKICPDCVLKNWEKNDIGVMDIYELAEELFEDMADAQSSMTEYEKDKYHIEFRTKVMRKHLDKLKEQVNEP